MVDDNINLRRLDSPAPLGYVRPMPMFIVRWVVLSLVILAVPHLIPGIRVDGLGAALATAIVLGILNTFLKPILLIFTLPITILTVGLFLIVINAFLLILAGNIVNGFHVDTWTSAALASIAISIASWMLSRFVGGGGGPRMQFYSLRQTEGTPREKSRGMRDVGPQ